MNIAQRLDRLPLVPMHWSILIATGVGWLFDSMDVGLISFVMPALQRDWGLSPAQLGLIGSVGMVGMALGAALSGSFADRYGRKKVILFTLVLFGLATGFAGLATGLTTMLLARFLVGLGLGGELPVASTLVSEISPLLVRGRFVVLLESFWAWGWIVAALIAYLLIPEYGWRVAFFIGAVPALAAVFLRQAIPESPRFLIQKGRYEEADAIVSLMEQQAGMEISKENKTKTQAKENGGTFSDLWSVQLRRRTLTLWILWLGINFGYYGFVMWIPTLLVGKGFIIIKSLQYVLLMTLAQIPGYFTAAYLIEVVGRKVVLTIFLAGTAISAYFFGQSDTVREIMVAGSFLYFFSLGAWGAVYAYTPENYPTISRGTGVGWAAAVGRLGAIAAPYLVGVVYQAQGKESGYTTVFLMLTVVFAVTALAVLFLGQETRGRSLA
ncbi:major facilitator superfamily MFS_1 [Desulforamulus reducens MI-1]|uniref:Major facilitator superfamily MFS_1 n=1 Tax=Desulforamulus reducens (strain ATCC BAA-1160 / DSM 100696 / MI-1) TaxID=349161 RepID=A4J4Q0_DESRM|nr:MFS transporter [Desulforamulus reducens]ABO50053.1 major facilitator superfamily MFS_1 [Desulforamulus reducens MI-1]